MTWCKLSDDHGDDCARAGLSDAAFRTHVEGLLWTMRRETGGHLDALDLRRLAESRHADAAVKELIDAGFWAVEGSGYLVIHGMEHQPEPEVLHQRRSLNADRQRRHRRKKAGLTEATAVTPSQDALPTRSLHALSTPSQDALPGTGRDGAGWEPSTTELRLQQEVDTTADEYWLAGGTRCIRCMGEQAATGNYCLGCAADRQAPIGTSASRSSGGWR